MEMYLAYVRLNYAENPCIVFDGYADEEGDNCTASSADVIIINAAIQIAEKYKTKNTPTVLD